MATWHDDDRFWEGVAPFLFGEEAWTGAPVQVDSMISTLGLRPGARILDLGCGIGRHSLELARRGFAVTGVDRTAAYLHQGREKADEEGLTVEFLQADMREFRRSGAFDAAISMFTSFGYFDDPEDNLRVLRNVADSLRPGGGFIIDVMGKEVLARVYQERDWVEVGDAIMLHHRRAINDWRRMENRWILIRGDLREEFTFSHWIYSAAELQDLLEQTGFRGVKVFGDMQGAPYDVRAKRLVLVARRET